MGLDLMDDGVFAVIMTLIVVISVFVGAQILIPKNMEPFSAIGLLDKNCMINNYPDQIYNGENLTLCLFVDNHEGSILLFRVVYKIGTNASLPTNSTPSSEEEILHWDFLLEDRDKATRKINVPVLINLDLDNDVSRRVALIFELWYLDPSSGEWVYTGRWVHLYVLVKRPVLGGGA